jgi:hypothetical protein
MPALPEINVAEILQKGNSPTVPVTKEETMRFYGKALSGGKAGQAVDDIKTRKQKLDAQIDGTTDPTSVEYGGHRGSSTGQ